MYVLALKKALYVSSCLTLVERNPTTFPSWMLSGYFSGSCAVGWGAQPGVYTPYFSLGSPWPLKYSPRTLAATHGSPANLLTSPVHSLPVSLW